MARKLHIYPRVKWQLKMAFPIAMTLFCLEVISSSAFASNKLVTCVAVLKSLRPYHTFQSLSETQSAEAYNVFRKFLNRQLGDVRNGTGSFPVSADERASLKTKKLLARRVAALLREYLNPADAETERADQQLKVFGTTFLNENAIRRYEEELQTSFDETKVINKDRSFLSWKLKERLFIDLPVIPGTLWFSYALLKPTLLSFLQGHPNFLGAAFGTPLTLGLGLAVAVQMESNVREIRLHAANDEKKVLNIPTLNNSNSDDVTWKYHSFDLPVDLDVTQNLWEAGVFEANDMFWLWKAARQARTTQEAVRQVVLRISGKDIKDGGDPENKAAVYRDVVWARFDQLQINDPKVGHPEYASFVRFSLRRPAYPAAATEKESAAEGTAVAIPSLAH
jgi:hypothetical protein